MITKNFVAPNLPLFKNDYNRLDQDQFANVLRLYFNLLDNYFSSTILDALNGAAGGNGITFPHIAASDSTNQIAGGNNTPTAVKWNTLNSGFGWTLNSPGSATCAVAGVYRITFRLQFINTANSINYATVWLKVNTVDATNSATIFTIPARKGAGAGNEGFLSAYSEATFTVQVGDEIELYWATDQAYVASPLTDGVYMLQDNAQTSPFARPAIPSASGSITWVSALT